MIQNRRVAVLIDKPWWLAGGIKPGKCAAAYRAKGANSLGASYSNLANPGTFDLEGATPTWNPTIGWTSKVSFTNLPLILSPLPMTVFWYGRLTPATTTSNLFVNTTSWAGFTAHTFSNGAFYIGMNASVTGRFILSLSGTKDYLIVYRKMANNYQNVWVNGILEGSQAGYTPTNFGITIGTGDGGCKSIAVYNEDLTETQIEAVSQEILNL